MKLHESCCHPTSQPMRGILGDIVACVCPRVRTLKGKRLELSTLNLVHACSTAVARHASIRKSKGQRSRSHGYETRHGHMAAVAVVLLLPVYVGLHVV